MRDPTRAPMYAAAYQGLCDKARELGYALAIHGTVTTDLDLVAIPWIDHVANPNELAISLRDHLGACFEPQEDVPKPVWEAKPHGRIACNLYMGFGAKVDLSVMPPLAQPQVNITVEPEFLKFSDAWRQT